jgi:hypothetical protein
MRKVINQAIAPKPRIHKDASKPCLNKAIRNARGVAINIGVNIIPIVRGKKKIPTTVTTPRTTRTCKTPPLKKLVPSLSPSQEYPR